MERRHRPPFAPEGLIYQLFRTAHYVGRAFYHIARAHGLSRTSGPILAHLSHEREGVTATELRRCVGVTAASMSHILADMERAQLITRTPNPHDARSMLVHLTDQGRVLMKAFPAMVAEIEARAFEDFSAAERDQLKVLLERVRANLGDDGSEDTFDWKEVNQGRQDIG
jgi:DNA-binding MarR family transcriptional regulator